MPSPYITPSYLLNWPTNIAWETIPDSESTPEEQLFSQQQMCATASTMCDNAVQQTLRASVYTEALSGPGHRMAVRNGYARFMTSFFPIVEVVQAQVSYNYGPPWTFQLIPAGYAVPEESPFSGYGTDSVGVATGGMNAILIGGGYVTWANGRLGTRVECTYINGWPHAGLITPSAVGDTSVHVDDVTGWLGVTGTMPDPNGREYVNVTAVTPDIPGQLTPSGPGVLTLATPLAYVHAVGELVTSLPETVLEAAVWFAVSQVLPRGVNAISAPPIPGHQGAGGAGAAMDQFISRAKMLLSPYKRQI